MRNIVSLICLIIFSSLLPDFAMAAVKRAQNPVAPATKEPERFAYIVGNARYQRANSNLDDLPDACSEVIQFRKRLLKMGWKADHLYPLVKPAAHGESEDDAMAAAICDKTGHELERSLTAFTELILLNENNPYGVVYFAGHGAQSNDEFYAFGVDASVDLKKEINLLLQFPNYEVFSRPPTANAEGPTAVNVTRIVSRVNGPKGKALLVIIDACRDDPVLEQFLSAPPKFTPRSADERLRLSIGYIASRPDKYDEMFNNILVLFAGRPGKTVLSGTGQAANWFSRQLFEYLNDPVNLRASAPTFVSDFQSRAKMAQSQLPSYYRQIPQHIGSMASSPIFCLQGCPQPLSVWTNEKVEFVTESSSATRRTDATTGIPKNTSVEQNEKLHGRLVSLMTQSSSNSVQADSSAIPESKPASSARPINLDVFYCAGDALEAQRKAAARTFAEETRRLAPRNVSLANTYIDQIRLRSLDVNVNLAMRSPKVGTSLVLVKSNPSSRFWLDKLGTGFDKTYMDDVTKGYIRAYFCTGFSPNQKPRPLVYTQVSHANQVPQAKQYLAQLRTGLPELKFVEGIEAVDDRHPDKIHTPKKTQVRCYSEEQCHQAETLADHLRKSVSKPVSVVRMRATGASFVSNPVIELWFGQEEMAGWQPAPHQ